MESKRVFFVAHMCWLKQLKAPENGRFSLQATSEQSKSATVGWQNRGAVDTAVRQFGVWNFLTLWGSFWCGDWPLAILGFPLITFWSWRNSDEIGEFWEKLSNQNHLFDLFVLRQLVLLQETYTTYIYNRYISICYVFLKFKVDWMVVTVFWFLTPISIGCCMVFTALVCR